MGGVCGTHGRAEKVFRVLVGKPEGKRSLRKPKHRWNDGIRLELREIYRGCGVDSVELGQRLVACSCERGDEHSGSIATELFGTILCI
jgi:hypothetical protein